MKRATKLFILSLLLISVIILNASEELNPLTVNVKKKFSSNESLKFSINTGKEKGFIYLVYIDKTGDKNLIYPNGESIEIKKSGKLNFPEDFDNIDLKTNKDCDDCKEEKTTIYVLLSNDPIENIDEINFKNQNRDKKRSLWNSEEPKLIITKLDFVVE